MGGVYASVGEALGGEADGVIARSGALRRLQEGEVRFRASEAEARP